MVSKIEHRRSRINLWRMWEPTSLWLRVNCEWFHVILERSVKHWDGIIVLKWNIKRPGRIADEICMERVSRIQLSVKDLKWSWDISDNNFGIDRYVGSKIDLGMIWCTAWKNGTLMDVQYATTELWDGMQLKENLRRKDGTKTGNDLGNGTGITNKSMKDLVRNKVVTEIELGRN